MEYTIIAIDDSLDTLDLFESILSDQYNFRGFLSGEEGFEWIKNNDIDILLLDVLLPGIDGFELCRKIRSTIGLKDIPIIFITSLTKSIDEAYGFKVGGNDYISKPFSAAVLRSRVKTQLQLSNQKSVLEEEVDKRTEELVLTQDCLINSLVVASEVKDVASSNHIDMVSKYTEVLAESIGYSEHDTRVITTACKLHDVGKIGIPDDILKKPGVFTPFERNEIQKHAEMGALILGEYQDELMQTARIIAYEHHERWNGTGYPEGKKGEEINQAARIVALADVFDALTSYRTYKEAWSFDKAFEFISEDSGHFDPVVRENFIKCKKQIQEIYEKHRV